MSTLAYSIPQLVEIRQWGKFTFSFICFSPVFNNNELQQVIIDSSLKKCLNTWGANLFYTQVFGIVQQWYKLFILFLPSSQWSYNRTKGYSMTVNQFTICNYPILPTKKKCFKLYSHIDWQDIISCWRQNQDGVNRVKPQSSIEWLYIILSFVPVLYIQLRLRLLCEEHTTPQNGPAVYNAFADWVNIYCTTAKGHGHPNKEFPFFSLSSREKNINFHEFLCLGEGSTLKTGGVRALVAIHTHRLGVVYENVPHRRKTVRYAVFTVPGGDTSGGRAHHGPARQPEQT